MRALLLAAGFGTRLGALSDERPKPLLPVCDLPALRYSLALLEAAGLTEAVINLHHRGDLIERELGDRAGAVTIRYSREESILGTGGGIRKAAEWLTRGGRERFLVLNGKLVLDLDLPSLLAAVAASDPAVAATLVLREVPDPDRWGAVETEGDEVVRIVGKGRPTHAATQQEATPGPARKWMFTGVHVLSPALVERLPPGESCIVRQGYVPALEQGVRLGFQVHRGYFEEHSTPRRYLDGNLALLRQPGLLRHPPGPLTGVDPTADIDPAATLLPPYRIGPRARVGAGATVGPDAVVGWGAVVEPGASLQRAVAWPESRVTGAVREAVVTPRGVLPVE